MILRTSADGGALKPDSNHQAHHIIPQGDTRAQRLRNLLSQAGVNINDQRKGIWLPRNEDVDNPGAVTPHNQTLRQTYFDYLEDKFRGASIADVPQLLAEVKRELENGRGFEPANTNNR